MSDVDKNGTPAQAPYAQYNGPTPTGAPSGVDPGKTLGIVAFVFAILVNFVGVILGIIALVQSRRAGYKNGLALAAIIVGSVFFVVSVILTIVGLAFVGSLTNQILQKCEGQASGTTIVIQGQTTHCP